MADNVTIPASGNGTATPVVATDDVGGVHYQKVKLDVGADGASTPVTGSVPTQGDVAHDAVDVGNPVKIGGKYTSIPGTVADGKRVDALFDGNGRLGVAPGNPSGASDAYGNAFLVELQAGDGSPGPLITGPLVFNGTTWDRQRGDAANGTDVDVTRLPSGTVAGASSLPSGTNNIGDVDVLTVPSPLSTAGNGTAATAHRVTIASDSTGQVAVASIAAGTNNIGDVDVLTVPSPLSTAGNGTAATAHRVTLASDSTGQVAVASIAAGNNNIGDVDVLSLPAIPAGTNNIGDVDVLSLPAIPAGNNNIGDVDVASTPKSGTATLSNVASSATSVTLLSSNASRLGATIVNDSTQNLFVKFGTTASSTSYTVLMIPNAYYEIPFAYTGRVDGIWASANGNARVTELT